MRIFCLFALSALLVAGLAGCEMSKPYVMKMDRVDQDVSAGNKGYLKGTPPPEKDRGELKRPFIAVDIELPEIKGPASKPTQINREISVSREETPTMVKESATVKEAEIK